MMRAMTWLLALLVAQSAWADKKPQLLTKDLAEIRDEVGPRADTTLRASPEEFAQALERVSNDHAGNRDQPRDGNRAQPNPSLFSQSPVRAPQSPEPNPPRFTPTPHQPTYPPQLWQQPGHGAWQNGPTHQPPRPAFQPEPPPSPEARLRDVAHRLDGLAHELEVAELFGAADAVRETAQRLREEARPKPGRRN